MRIDTAALRDLLSRDRAALQQKAEAIQAQIDAICTVSTEDPRCSGDAYRSLCDYLVRLRLPALMQQMSYLAAYRADMERDAQRLAELAAHGQAVIDTDSIRSRIDTLETKRLRLNDWLRLHRDDVPEAVQTVVLMCDDADEQICHLKRMLEDAERYLTDSSIYATSGAEAARLHDAQTALSAVVRDQASGAFDLSGADTSWVTPALFASYAAAVSALSLKLGRPVAATLAVVLRSLLGDSSATCAFGGDPVNMATGNFVWSQEYLRTRSMPSLSCKLFYNSQGQGAACLARGWTHSFEMRFARQDGQATVSFADGRIETYLGSPDGSFVALAAAGGSLEADGDGALYRDGTRRMRYRFDADGRLSHIEGEEGGVLSLSYADALLQRVEDEYGRFLSFSYDTEGRVASAADHAGRAIRLAYEDGQLAAITDEKGAIRRFSYDGKGLLARISDALGTEELANAYDGDGRVHSQTFADGGTISYRYDDAAGELAVTDALGTETVYVRDGLYRTTAIAQPRGRERFTYDEHGRRASYTDRRGHTWRYSHDEHGNMTSLIDPLGEQTDITYGEQRLPTEVSVCGKLVARACYDDAGRLIRRTDALGQSVEIRRDHAGRAQDVAFPDGSAISFAYDEKGNIASICDPRRGKICYEYDAAGNVSASVDALGNRTEYRHDARGNLQAVKNAEGNTRSYAYDAAGRLIEIVDFDGVSERRVYNAMGRIQEATLRGGATYRFEYDALQNLTARIDPLGNRTEMAYDAYGNIVRVTDPDGAVTECSYDSCGNRTEVKGPNGAVTRTSYDALGRPIATRDAAGATTSASYTERGALAQVTDELGRTRRFSYDACGRLIGEQDVLGKTVSYERDAAGNVVKVCDEALGETSYEYLPGGLLAKMLRADGTWEKYSYDAAGNLMEKLRQDGSSLAYSYDSLGRIRKVEGSWGWSESYAYDAVGNVTAVTDALGNTTRYRYSQAGGLVETVDALGTRTLCERDALGRLVSLEQLAGEEAPGQEGQARITRYEYDAAGRVSAVTDALGAVEAYRYDSAGHLASKVDRDGYTTSYTHDAVGNLTDIAYDDGRTVRLSYDALRQLTEMNDWLGTTTIARDRNGLIERVRDHAGREVAYEHDGFGRRTALVYPDGQRAEYLYDEAGRLSSLAREGLEVRYAYDGDGRLAAKSFSSGYATEYLYDASGALARLTHMDADGTIDAYAYTRDARGKTIAIDRRRRGLEKHSGLFSYTYDALGRLVCVQRDGSPVREYTYDAFGNRTSMKEGMRRSSYTYDEANRLTELTANGSTLICTYDARGNLTSMGDPYSSGTTWSYDATNRLEWTIEVDGDSISTYEYNGLGRRVGADVFTRETCDWWQGLNGSENLSGQLHDLFDPEVQEAYVLDVTRPANDLVHLTFNDREIGYLWDGSLLASFEQEKVCSYLLDELGSPARYLGDGVAQAYAYDEFGNSLIANWDAVQPFGFAGYCWDESSWTWFAKAREYMPYVGRFTARDVVKGSPFAPATLNEYAYCLNDPLGYLDLDGLAPVRIGIAPFDRGNEAHYFLRIELEGRYDGAVDIQL